MVFGWGKRWIQKKEGVVPLATKALEPLEPAWVGIEREVYLKAHTFLPKIPQLKPYNTRASSVLNGISSGMKYTKKVAPALLPVLTTMGVLPAVALVGAIVTAEAAVTEVLDTVVDAIKTKNAIVKAINETTQLLPERLTEKLKPVQEQYKTMLKHALDCNKDALTSKEYKDAVTKASDLYLSAMTDVYNQVLGEMVESALTTLEKEFPNSKKLDHAEWLPRVKTIMNVAVILTTSATNEYAQHSVKDAIALEQQKMQLRTKALAIMAEHKLFGDDGLNFTTLEQCDKRELTILMMAAKEAEIERKRKAGSKERRFSDFDNLPQLEKLEEIRKTKSPDGFAFESGPFQKALSKHQPKAMARMLAYTASGDSISNKVSNKDGLNSTIAMLEATPCALWNDIEELGHACRKRECCGVVARSFLGAANKVSNILRNIIGRGVKDKALTEALKDFGSKMDVQVITRPVVDTKVVTAVRAR